MATGDTLRRITAQDQLIIDSGGNVVGVKSPNANGADLRFDPANVAILGGTAQLSSGTVAAPSLAFAAEPGTGVYRPSVSNWGVAINGSPVFKADGAGIAFGGKLDVGFFGDTFLLRDAANTVAQRNGSAAQAFNLYNFFTDVNNYERGFAQWSGNEFQVGVAFLGTGVSRGTKVLGGNGTGFLTLNDTTGTSLMYGTQGVAINSIQVSITARNKAGAFVAGDVASGSFMVGRDTTNLTTKLYYNNGGTLMAVALA